MRSDGKDVSDNNKCHCQSIIGSSAQGRPPPLPSCTPSAVDIDVSLAALCLFVFFLWGLAVAISVSFDMLLVALKDDERPKQLNLWPSLDYSQGGSHSAVPGVRELSPPLGRSKKSLIRKFI